MNPFCAEMRNPGIRDLRPTSRGLKTNTIQSAGSYWAVTTSFSLALSEAGWGGGV